MTKFEGLPPLGREDVQISDRRVRKGAGAQEGAGFPGQPVRFLDATPGIGVSGLRSQAVAVAVAFPLPGDSYFWTKVMRMARFTLRLRIDSRMRAM